MRLPKQRYRWSIVLLTITSQVLSGCSQTEHRLAADREAYCTIAERNGDPRWSESNLNIDMDPRSRYFDPYDPDCSPIPMDDPASHRYMHCVDGKKGWAHWGRNGRRAHLENPQWRANLAEYTDFTKDNAVKLDVDSAVKLAYVHSPLNQRALETLYLTSLDVTGERFRLDTQFFGGTGGDYRHEGGLSPGTIAFNPLLGRYEVSGPFNTPEVNRLTDGGDSGSVVVTMLISVWIEVSETGFPFTWNDKFEKHRMAIVNLSGKKYFQLFHFWSQLEQLKKTFGALGVSLKGT